MANRPWKVLAPGEIVFSFATEDRARARAEQLVSMPLVINGTERGPYVEVFVIFDPTGRSWAEDIDILRRTSYHCDRPPVEQTYRPDGWVAR